MCLTRKSTQARKIGENLAHFPGNTDSSPQNECCCQKSDGIFEKEKCKKGFLLLPEWHRAHRVDGALGFAGEMLGGLLERRLVLPQLALPLGISFFTFQQISYLVDTCRGTQFRTSLKSKQFHRRWCSPAASLSKKPRRVWRRKPPNKIKSFSVGACT